ncbi:MAG: hypothetical protein QW291_04455 [Thermofilaceae archaeon]
MGFINDVIRTLRATKKADPKTYKVSLKVVGLGFVLLGSLGYLFQLIGAGLRMVKLATVSSDVITMALAAVAAITLAAVLYLRRKAS